jgi:hypothetical protein
MLEYELSSTVKCEQYRRVSEFYFGEMLCGVVLE